jgi:hypothetical protein
MSAADPTDTARAFLFYSTGNAQHSIENRYDHTTMSELDALANMGALLEGLSDFFYTITLVKAEFSNQGSSVRIPTDLPTVGTIGSGTEPVVNVPRSWSITGKSNDGRRWRQTLFGINNSVPNSWRLARATDNLVDTWLPLVSTISPDWLSISGLPIFFNQYANVNDNDHWIANQRVS